MYGTILVSARPRKPVREMLVVLAALLSVVAMAALLASPAWAATGDGNGSAIRDVGAYEYVPKPVLSLPADRSVEPNTTEGATVSYQATATDAFNQALDVSCDHTSGSAFAAGETTTVTCSATDSAGQTTTDSFTVTVSKVETGLSLGTNAQQITVGKTQTLSGTLPASSPRISPAGRYSSKSVPSPADPTRPSTR